MGRHGDEGLDAPTEVMGRHPTRSRWLLPGLVTAFALVVSVVALVVIVRGVTTTSAASGPAAAASAPPPSAPTASAPIVGDRGADPEDLPSAPVESVFPELACQGTVLAALEQDNTVGNRIEAVRIYRTYGESSPQNRAYDDVSSGYFRTAQRSGVAAASAQYREEVLRSCRDEPSYRVMKMREGIEVQYPEIDELSDEQLLAFRSWVCPIRNGKGKPTASVLIQQRYDVSNAIAYLMMDSSAC